MEYSSKVSKGANSLNSPSNRAGAVTGRVLFVCRPDSRTRNSLVRWAYSPVSRISRHASTHTWVATSRRLNSAKPVACPQDSNWWPAD